MWESLDEEEDDQVSEVLVSNAKQRLSCFAHSLQLVIGNGMKDTRCVSGAIATLLHRSTIMKERFENSFGKGGTIPAANATRWNSTFYQLRAILNLDLKTLTDVCGVDFSNVSFSSREWNQLTKLGEILTPFSEATDLTQGEKCVTISMVVLTTLDLYTHLRKMKDRSRHCRPLLISLTSSLKKRFSGIFTSCNMPDPVPGSHDLPFSDKVYLIAPVLDHQFAMHWVDMDVWADVDAVSLKRMREDLKDTLQDLVIAEADSTSNNASSSSQEENSEDDQPPSSKVPRLLAKYQSLRNRNKSGDKNSTRLQMAKLLDHVNDLEPSLGCLEFWTENRGEYPTLYKLALRTLKVPASSAPVERIFSRGGIIMRPHRARLSADNLTKLMFLKCNEDILQNC